MKSGSRLSRASFAEVSASRKRVFGCFLTLACLPTGEAVSVVVSKKVARTAVSRNRLRRRLFAIARSVLNEKQLRGSCIVYTKKGSAERNFTELSEELTALLLAASLPRRSPVQ